VQALHERDAPRILEYLGRDPLLNVFLISRIRDEGMIASNMVSISRGGSTIAAASLATNVVIAAERPRRKELLEAAMDALAERILARSIAVRAIVSEAELVEPLWNRLERHLEPPTVARLIQPIYALEEMTPALPELGSTRYSTAADLPQLVPACAAMHLEEVGINPLDRDTYGYRERIRELVASRRSMLRIEGGRIAFKCEFSAVTPSAVQLMGVWTAPPLRRRGIGREALAEICGHLLRQGKKVTLFVNDFNTPAIRLYESLGFRRIGTNRALIW
jgi:predicted GNAT family acetyltransferase